jgi:hypothetical protein
MPLEISEIGVHIAVGDGPAIAAQVAPAATSAGSGGAAAGGAMTPQRMEAMVRACVQETLRTLRMGEER